jgi:outer membrane protein OmpA-like peptidoglycan-associated protein/tetratricopeptide (TPR) repeat protein
MKKYIFIFISLVSLFSFNSYAQKNKALTADKKYDSYSYIDAIKTYERVAEKGYKSVDMFQKLGNSYYFNSEFEKAAKWYGELFAMNSDQDSEFHYRYGQSLKSIGENEKANQILEKFHQKAAKDSRGILLDKNRNYLKEIQDNSGRYKIEDAGINSKFSDYGSSFFQNKLVFASARDTGSLGQRKHKWTNQYFTNLYTTDLDDTKSPISESISKFSNSINSKFHESTPVFTKDGKTMYFTRNNYNNGKKGKDENRVTLIKIYKATLNGEKWGNITELPFNNDSYSTAHPTLSTDEKTLYFASDMPGTLGQSDIFRVTINDDGTFGVPQNIGKPINTEGKETFPHITDENEIYFASDGHPGLGGLDIFVSKINSDNTFDKVQNLGSEANSPKDDFAFIIDTKSRRGFLTSNRNGGKGYDDIYKFIEIKKLICEQVLSGIITDKEDGQVLPDTKLTIFDSQLNAISTTISNKDGYYSFKVECGKMYQVRAEKTDYTTIEKNITIPDENGVTDLPFVLEKSGCKVTVGDDLGKCFGIKMIYFDLDKHNIRREAEFDLEKILDVMIQHPTMKIDVRSHTDCRQTIKYNEGLSDRRAKSTIAWLISKGIEKSRLTGKGYGESQLVNDCRCEPTNESSCTEEQHQMNRRSEFIITAL